MTTEPREAKGLRVVAFSVLPPAYGIIREWAARNEHRLTLLVTTPGPTARRSTTYRDVIAMAPPEQEILVTTRPKQLAPIIREKRPDLVLSFTFPYRIPPEVTAIPRLGAVNLHPAPLPLYRGPTPIRMIYDAHPTLRATLHRTEEDFDTGVIYSMRETPMPDEVTPENIFAAWGSVMAMALDEGVRRAVSGHPGEVQDHACATYAAPFTAEDEVLDWSLPARLLQCRVTALALFDGGGRAEIDGVERRVHALTPLRGVAAPEKPGVVLARAGNIVTLCAGDGVVQVTVG
jgi:methionyl-tRNA formyltransferase